GAAGAPRSAQTHHPRGCAGAPPRPGMGDGVEAVVVKAEGGVRRAPADLERALPQEPLYAAMAEGDRERVAHPAAVARRCAPAARARRGADPRAAWPA